MESRCPKCNSTNIHYDISSGSSLLEMSEDKISALKFGYGSENKLQAECMDCEATLIPTQNGFRIQE